MASTAQVTTLRRYSVTIQGVGGLLMNRMLSPDEQEAITPKAKETHADRERRTWREKLYYDDELGIFLPGENLQACLEDGSKYWGAKIPGEGNKRWTDVIKSSCIIEDAPIHASQWDDPPANRMEMINPDHSAITPYGRWVNGNPNGSKGGSKVWRIRPMIVPWECTFRMSVFDARLTADVLTTIITYAGKFKGIGDNRPRFGRFDLLEIAEEK